MDNQALLKEALQLMELRHFDQALPLLKKLAKKNQVDSLYHLGYLAFHGYAMEKNPKLAFESLQKAALELHVKAMYYLGRCYEQGFGVEQNYEKAMEYYTAAGTKGYDDAILRAAFIHDQGYLGNRKRQVALQMYVELSKKNHPYATYQIGMAYLHGDGVQKSAENAYSWLNKALSLGSVDAMNQFRVLGNKSKDDHRSKEDVFVIGKKYYEEEDYLASMVYLEIASQEGIIEAYLLLARALLKAQKDLSKAFEYFLKAANHNHSEAMMEVAHAYEAGLGVPSSALQAAFWLEKALKEAHPRAQAELRQLRGY